MYSFVCTQVLKGKKDTDDIILFFTLSGSTSIKAASKCW
jgi:hypothetical protein